MYEPIGADLIFYKPVTDGTLYALKFKKGNEKQHSTVSNAINLLDETLKLNGGRDSTYFVSINNDDSLTGSKVLSFERGGRKSDPLYRKLFDRKDSILPGVTVWTNEIGDAAELNGDNAIGGSSDEDVEEEIAVSLSNGKKSATDCNIENCSMIINASAAGSVLQVEKVISF